MPRGEPFLQLDTASVDHFLHVQEMVYTPSHLSRRAGPPPRPGVSSGLRASLALDIRGTAYRVSVRPEGIELARPDGTTHYVMVDDDGPECSCHSAFYRANGRDCKHIRSLVAAGLIPATEPALV